MEETNALLPYMESRTEFYEMLHKLYRWPLTQEDLDALDAGEFEQLAEELDDGLMKRGFNDMYRFLRRRNTGTRQVLATDFTKVFLGTATYEGFSAQPFASLFVGAGGQLMGAARTRTKRVYQENAVALSEGIDLPEDHLAFQCEFLAIINQRATDALRADDPEAALDLLDTELRFLNENVLDWFPRFYALAQKLVDTRFYRGVLRMTKGFFLEEQTVIPEIIEDVREAAQSEPFAS